MATAPALPIVWDNGYPTSDGKPMAETDWHRNLMVALIDTLDTYYAADPLVYVSGDLLLFYEPGNKRKHVAPEVFVVKGVPKHDRPNYLIWEERKGPDLVIELTSSSTRHEDTVRKFQLYQNVLRVKEYFLYDPLGHYLRPSLQGYRLHRGKYVEIAPLKGQLPSRVVGLLLQPMGRSLRLFDPIAKAWLQTAREEVEDLRRQLNFIRRGLNSKS